jgi:hypothetical protein
MSSIFQEIGFSTQLMKDIFVKVVQITLNKKNENE